MQEKFRAKGKKLYCGIVDFEKAFDKVPRKVIRWAMRMLGVEEWLVLAVMSTYTGAKTLVSTVYGNSNCFCGRGRSAARFSIESIAICNCHGSFIW